MDVNRLWTALRSPETARDKWLRAAITGAGAGLLLLIAIVILATAGGDGGGSATTWKTATGTVTDVRVHNKTDDDGNVTGTNWFVTYEYTIDAYRIKTDQLNADLYAKGDTVTVYYDADDHEVSRLTAPDDDDDDDGGGSFTLGVILLIVAGLLTALAALQIVDLRRDAQGPNA